MSPLSAKPPACLDVAIIGGGPAGISAGLELSQQTGLNVALFERERQLGGIPRSCHIFFGMRDLKRMYTGPAYARRLDRWIRRTPVQIHTQATVLKLYPGSTGEAHRFDVLSPQGLVSYESRYILLATGCCESSRHKRMIPGSRPAGIFTTGTLQQLVNLDGMRFSGRRAVIIGSEHVALSCVLTLKRAGVSIAAMVEEDSNLHTYAMPAAAMGRYYGFPILRDAVIEDILGNDTVEGVSLLGKRTGRRFQLACDMVVVTGKFQPESSLIDETPIERDAHSAGPVVNMDLATSIPEIFAAGNVLRGADMHDLCALEGRLVARRIIDRIASAAFEKAGEGWLAIKAEPPIRYVVPQRIPAPLKKRRNGLRCLPGPGFQLNLTLSKATVAAVCGSERIWARRYRKLIANHRYALPLDSFDWQRVKADQSITLKLRSDAE